MDSSHSTRSCVLIFFVALLCAERAQGLECYHCPDDPPESSCNTTTCPFPDGFCVTQEAEIIVDSQRRKVKSRQCLSYCPTDLENSPIKDPKVKVKISCCQEDLCNAAFPTGGNRNQGLITGNFQGALACGGEAQEMSN
uniref:UPAR/Ly6 domain-containing protein n=1 Tax=Mus spicilegus TaxID=10103 RepID=A0A8C6I338_MUSSI